MVATENSIIMTKLTQLDSPHILEGSEEKFTSMVFRLRIFLLIQHLLKIVLLTITPLMLSVDIQLLETTTGTELITIRLTVKH